MNLQCIQYSQLHLESSCIFSFILSQIRKENAMIFLVFSRGTTAVNTCHVNFKTFLIKVDLKMSLKRSLVLFVCLFILAIQGDYCFVTDHYYFEYQLKYLGVSNVTSTAYEGCTLVRHYVNESRNYLDVNCFKNETGGFCGFSTYGYIYPYSYFSTDTCTSDNNYYTILEQGKSQYNQILASGGQGFENFSCYYFAGDVTNSSLRRSYEEFLPLFLLLLLLLECISF
jgi:hypothetical protein